MINLRFVSDLQGRSGQRSEYGSRLVINESFTQCSSILIESLHSFDESITRVSTNHWRYEEWVVQTGSPCGRVVNESLTRSWSALPATASCFSHLTLWLYLFSYKTSFRVWNFTTVWRRHGRRSVCLWVSMATHSERVDRCWRFEVYFRFTLKCVETDVSSDTTGGGHVINQWPPPVRFHDDCLVTVCWWGKWAEL